QTCQHFRNCGMSNRQDVNSDPRAECTCKVEENDSDAGSLRLTGLRIVFIHDGVHPHPNFAGLLKVSDAGVRDLLRLREVCQNRGEREGEKKPFHVRLPPTFLGKSAQRWCKMQNDWRISADSRVSSW